MIIKFKKSGEQVPLVANIPHSSMIVPKKVAQKMMLNSDQLSQELIRMTDMHTDDLFMGIVRHGGCAVISEISRLVVDLERFSDDQKEIMAELGMGVIYRKTSHLKELREYPEPEERSKLLKEYYWPYHEVLQEKADACLLSKGKCIVIDCHSFPSRPLPYELDQENRPDICIGSDGYHTSKELQQLAVDYFRRENLTVAVNQPFKGALVPMKFYKKDRRVQSIMLEINRKLYMDEASGEKNENYVKIKEIIDGFAGELADYVSDFDGKVLEAYRNTTFCVNDLRCREVFFTVKDAKKCPVLKKKKFAVITACNPMNELRSGYENENNNKLLETEIIKQGHYYYMTIGLLGDHKEESFTIEDISQEEAVLLGKQFKQFAILYNDEDGPRFLRC